MSADYLRETAALMRQRAKAATSGPWQADEGASGGWWVEASNTATIADLDIDYSIPKADAEHIASWHPDVAVAVADLLDDGAAYLEFVEQMHAEEGPGDEGRLFLAVARAYRGES